MNQPNAVLEAIPIIVYLHAIEHVCSSTARWLADTPQIFALCNVPYLDCVHYLNLRLLGPYLH